MTKKTTKKRTKTAIAARKYERKLKQRVRSGEPQAKAIIQRRKDYSERYESERRRKREAERRTSTQDEVSVVAWASAERRTGKRTPAADSAIGVLEDGGHQGSAELKQEPEDEAKNPLFVTPAPDILASDSRTLACGFTGRIAEKGEVTPMSGSTQGHGSDIPGSSRSSDHYTQSAETSRPRLLRRSLGGALLRSADSAENLGDPVARESVEDLQAQLEGVRRQREELIKREIDIGIKIRQWAKRSRALKPRTVVNHPN